MFDLFLFQYTHVGKEIQSKLFVRSLNPAFVILNIQSLSTAAVSSLQKKKTNKQTNKSKTK